MPYINLQGKYRTLIYDGDTSFNFTTYNNNLCVIRRPNELSFTILRQYIPGQAAPFTTFEPGSAYTIIGNDPVDFLPWQMGPYNRLSRLPSSTNVKSPIFYIGLDINSIVVPISSYVLGVNSPLSSISTTIFQNGYYTRLGTTLAEFIKEGGPVPFTHFLPGSAYQLRTRVPFTLFAPLKTEMGDAHGVGQNTIGEYGMGHRYSFVPNNYTTDTAEYRLYGLWDKVVFGGTGNNDGFALALSACGYEKRLFVVGKNDQGQLGLGDYVDRQVWTSVAGNYIDIAAGARHSVVLKSTGLDSLGRPQGSICVAGSNSNGQLGFNSLSPANYTPFWDLQFSPFNRVFAGPNFTLGQDSAGYLWAVGDNNYGQLGTGTTGTNSLTFVRLYKDSPTNFIQLRLGNNGVFLDKVAVNNRVNSLVLLSGSQLFGTGYQSLADFSYGVSPTNTYPSFTRESTNLTDITDVYMGINGTFVKRSGSSYFFAAGLNDNSQLGI